ncbi:MAG: hypothetical protein Q9170_004072 [Blastenia crenularia]
MDELNHQLKASTLGPASSNMLTRTDNSECQTLPGRPQLSLRSDDLSHQLMQEFHTRDLDTLSPYLWLVATQSSAHINPLHEHVLKGRTIVVTENPELHLVWTNHCIFIKPIPPYMLSYAFWTTHLTSTVPSNAKDSRSNDHSSLLLKAALGFMRTYYHLIQSESDLRIAKESHLLPLDGTEISLDTFYRFIAGFGDVQDCDVSTRYSSYGTLRLSRLNFWAKIFLRRFQFYPVQPQYGEYFARFYAPILFLFGVLSVVLSAMQVGLQADGGAGGNSEGKWKTLQSASLWFSLITLLCICVLGLVIASLLSFMLLREMIYATKGVIIRRRRSSNQRISTND